MFPDSLLADIPWVLNDTAFDSVEALVKAVSEYYAELEMEEDWEPGKTAIDATTLTIITEDHDDEEFSFEVKRDGQSFSNGELLFKVHNGFAQLIKDGVELGDHCFFEGLSLVDASQQKYACYLGS